MTRLEYDDRPKDWTKSTSHADFLDALANESERDGLTENARRLRSDAAWYRSRFTPKDGKNELE